MNALGALLKVTMTKSRLVLHFTSFQFLILGGKYKLFFLLFKKAELLSLPETVSSP